MAVVSAPAPQASWWYRNQRKYIPYLYIAPFFLLFLVFGAYPIIYSFVMSLYKGLGLGPKTFYGLGNYAYLLGDPRYMRALANTVFFTLASVFVLSPLALMLALAIQSAAVHFRMRGFYRLIFYLPVITSSVIISVLFQRVLDTRYGLLNQFLATFNRPGFTLEHDWLRDTARVLGFGWLSPLFTAPVIGGILNAGTVVLVALFLMNIWNFIGVNSLYWTAGLNAISQELYEAAAIDGAGRWDTFWRVTFPLLRPMTLFIVIQAITGSFAVFAQPLLLTGGGPADATLTLSFYLYLQGFSIANFGYANAIGYSMALMTLSLSLLNLWLFRDKDK